MPPGGSMPAARLLPLRTSNHPFMPESFKKNFNGVDYVLYRTSILNDITYFVMFDDEGKRNSVRIAKVNGQWRLPDVVPQHIRMAGTELIQLIEENEIK
jgi:hypothetical protein